MPKLSSISPKKLMKILKDLGFDEVRVHGSHHFYRNSIGITTVIPVHGNEDTTVGLLKKILRDIGLKADAFENMR